MLRRLIVTTLLIAPLVGAMSASAQDDAPPQPGLGIRLAEAPADRATDPRARRYIIDHVAPGARLERRFELSNGDDRTLEVTLYGGPARIQGGRFDVADASDRGGVGEWVSSEPASVAIPAGDRVNSRVVIEVPRDTSAGEYYGVLWAETPGVVPPGGGVAVNRRVGIRLYLSVGPGGEPGTDFELPAFRPVRDEDGRPSIEIDGCNTGGRAIDLEGDIRLANGPGGVQAGPFPTADPVTLAPEQCHTFAIPLDKELPLGPWDATAKLRSGKEERTAEARITFPKEPGQRGKKVETREVTGTLPGIIATGTSVFLLLLLTGGLLWFLLKRRKRKKDGEDEESDGA